MKIVEVIKKILNNNLYTLSLYSRQIAGTLVLFVIARYLSVYDYGVFSSYRAISGFILILACLGYNEYILVSSKKNIHEVRLKIALFLLNAFGIILLTSVISLISPIEMHLIFMLVLFRTFFDNTFFLLILSYFQAANKFKEIAYINFIYSFLVVVVSGIAYLGRLSLLKFLFLSCLVGGVNFLQCSYYVRINYFGVLFKIKRYIMMLDKSIFGYMGVMLAFILYSQIPSLYVATYLSKETAATYFSAFTIASVIGLLIAAQNQKIVPEMINSTKEKVEKLIKNNFKLVMGINTLIFAFFCITGKNLLTLIYGQEYYSNGYYPLLIFTLSNISLALANIYGAYITASGNQHLKIRMQVEAIFIAIVSLAILHKLGIYAATISYFLSATHIGIRYVIKTKQLLRLNNTKETLCKSKN